MECGVGRFRARDEGRSGERPTRAEGGALLFMNSLMNVAFALNVGDFARKHDVASGAQWTVRIEGAKP